MIDMGNFIAYINGMLNVLSIINQNKPYISFHHCSQKINQADDLFTAFPLYDKIVDIQSKPINSFIGDIESEFNQLYDKSYPYKVIYEIMDNIVFLENDLNEQGVLDRYQQDIKAFTFTHIDKTEDSQVYDFEAKNTVYILNYQQGSLILQFSQTN